MEKELLKEFFLGFIKIHILYHAEKEEVFGQEFSNELRRHGYEISFGTLYPIFHRMEGRGLIISENRNVRGKIRKYYRITPKGSEVLAEAKARARELVDELFEE